MADEITILSGQDVAQRLPAADAVAFCRQAILAAHHGELVSPPRVHAQLAGGRFTYTAGELIGRWYGYRAYDTMPVSTADQLVVVHNSQTGAIAGLAHGPELGHIRTGAIGGVAADALAKPSANTLGLIGTGPQAWMQLWAIHTVRPLREVKVYSRDHERRNRFAQNASQRYGIIVSSADSAEEAVADMDMVVLATSSSTPVVESSAIAKTAFVTTLGPKQAGRAEFDASLAANRSQLATDSVAQLYAYDPPFVLRGEELETRLVSLGAVLNGEVARHEGAVFCSVGLAGTEAYILAKLLGL